MSALHASVLRSTLSRLALTGVGVVVLAAAAAGPAGSARVVAQPALAPAAVTLASGPTKVLVVMEENESASTAYPQMPYLASLSRTYGKAASYSATAHPSLPNYLAIAGGSTFGVTDDAGPSSHPLSGTSVFGAARAHGRTAKAYAESMPSNCATSSSGYYAVRHNPWAYFASTTERSLCRSYDVPLGTTSSGALVTDVRGGTLPNVGMVTPNLIHDGHDASLASADAWLKSWLPVIMAGPDYQGRRLAIVVTFDEGDGSNQKVAFTVVSPYLHGYVNSTAYNHYNLSKALYQVGGATPLRQAATVAGDLKATFKL